MMPGERALGGREQHERLVGEQVDEPAQQPEGRLVVELEEHADRDERQHHRRQHQHHQDAAQRELPGEQQRQQEADDQLQQHRRADDQRGGLEALPDVVVGQHPFEVPEPDELGLGQPVRAVVEEAQTERPEQREDVHHEQHDDRRGDQQRSARSGASQPGEQPPPTSGAGVRGRRRTFRTCGSRAGAASAMRVSSGVEGGARRPIRRSLATADRARSTPAPTEAAHRPVRCSGRGHRLPASRSALRPRAAPAGTRRPRSSASSAEI